MDDVNDVGLAAAIRASKRTLGHFTLAIESTDLLNIKLGQLCAWGDRIWHSNVARPDSKFWVVPDPVLDHTDSVRTTDLEPRSQFINRNFMMPIELA